MLQCSANNSWTSKQVQFEHVKCIIFKAILAKRILSWQTMSETDIHILYVYLSEWFCCIEGHIIWYPYGWLRCQKQICSKKCEAFYILQATYNLIRFCLLNCTVNFVRIWRERGVKKKIENTLNLFIYTNYSFSPVPWSPFAIGNIPFSKTTNVCKFLKCCKFWWYCDFSAFIWISMAMCHDVPRCASDLHIYIILQSFERNEILTKHL